MKRQNKQANKNSSTVTRLLPKSNLQKARFMRRRLSLILASEEQLFPDFFVHVSQASDNVWNNPADERWDNFEITQ